MTTRHAGYLVTLEHDMREDDAQAIVDAIGLLRGVVKVAPVEGGVTQAIADNRARHRLLEKLIAVAQAEAREG